MKNAFLIILSLLILSCTDDHSKEDVITTGSWIRTGHLSDYHKDGFYEEDTYSKFDECEKDNIYTFNIDGTEIIDEGLIKCEEHLPQNTSFPWYFSDKETVLHFQGRNYQIDELTATTLRLQGTAPHNVIFTIDVRMTFTKQ